MLLTSLLLLLLAVISRTVNGLYAKYALKKVDSFSYFFFVNILICIAVLPFIYTSIPSFFTLPALLILALLGAGVIQALSGVMSNYALQSSPVTVYTTLSQLQVVWVIVLGVVFLSEEVTLLGSIGVGLILLASLLVSGSIHIRKETGMRPIFICILSSVLSALAILVDKVLVDEFDQLFYFFLMLFIPIFFVLPDYMRRSSFYNEQLKAHFSVYLISALSFGLSYYSLLSLYSLPDVPLSVAYPIRSTSSIFVAALAIVIFGENKNKVRKLIATVLAVIGAIVVHSA